MSSLSQFSSKSEFNSSSLISRASSKNWLVLALLQATRLAAISKNYYFLIKTKKTKNDKTIMKL